MMAEKRIRGFLVEKKSSKCNDVDRHEHPKNKIKCKGTLESYYWLGTDIICEYLTCDNKNCQRYVESIKYENDGIKEAGETKLDKGSK